MGVARAGRGGRGGRRGGLEPPAAFVALEARYAAATDELTAARAGRPPVLVRPPPDSALRFPVSLLFSLYF